MLGECCTGPDIVEEDNAVAIKDDNEDDEEGQSPRNPGLLEIDGQLPRLRYAIFCSGFK